MATLVVLDILTNEHSRLAHLPLVVREALEAHGEPGQVLRTPSSHFADVVVQYQQNEAAWMEGQVTMSSMRTITIPEVELSLDQLVTAIRQLEPAARSEIAKALIDTELDARMAELIQSLSSRPTADDVTDADIVTEVNAVRKQRRQ